MSEKRNKYDAEFREGAVRIVEETRKPIAQVARDLGVKEGGLHTTGDRRRDTVDRAVATAFKAARGLHGSPRLVHDLRDDGWTVNEKTVADSMRRQGLVARKIRRRNGLARQDRTAPKFPDLIRRDFTAGRPNVKWVGDMTEIPIEHGKLYLATVIDLYSRRLLGAATGLRPDAELACDAIKMAVATRGGREAIWRAEESERVIFHSDRGSTYTANAFTRLCRHQAIRQSMGRVGSCFDNAAAEAFLQLSGPRMSLGSRSPIDLPP